MANENSQKIPYKCMDTIRMEIIKLQKKNKSKSTTLVRKETHIQDECHHDVFCVVLQIKIMDILENLDKILDTLIKSSKNSIGAS